MTQQPDLANEMQRFHLRNPGIFLPSLIPDDSGLWVSWEDATKEIERLQAEVERLGNELLKARQLFQDQLITTRAELERLQARLGGRERK